MLCSTMHRTGCDETGADLEKQQGEEKGISRAVKQEELMSRCQRVAVTETAGSLQMQSTALHRTETRTSSYRLCRYQI